MSILLLGANGRTGRAFMEQALAAGLSVRAVVRSTDRLSDVRHNHLEICVADPTNADALAELMSGQSAVVSALGPRSPGKSASMIYSRSGTAIVSAMQKTGVSRLIVTSTALLFPDQGVFEKVLSFLVGQMVGEAKKMENTIKASRLDWTTARLGFLTNESAASYRVSREQPVSGSKSVSRMAVAHFLVDALRTGEYCNECVGIGDPA